MKHGPCLYLEQESQRSFKNLGFDIHSREIETLYVFDGKYMGYCLKY